MSTFDEREKAYESRFAHDEELRFKSIARRNKLLGAWAAEQLGHTGSAADDYVRSVVRADFEEPGEEDVYRKVRGDFDAAGLPIDDTVLRQKMRELLVTAAEQVSSQ